MYSAKNASIIFKINGRKGRRSGDKCKQERLQLDKNLDTCKMQSRDKNSELTNQIKLIRNLAAFQMLALGTYNNEN